MLFLIYGTSFCKGQDSPVVLSPGMFDNQAISLKDGWLFKQGNNTAWAKKDINISSWKKINLRDLTAKYADKEGRLECWFRIKIKLDATFGKQQFGLEYALWAAADVYINGELVASFGNTGQNGTPYIEYRESGSGLPVPVNLQPGNEYIIAVHFVDHLSPFLPRHLKSEDTNLHPLLALTGPQRSENILISTNRAITYSTIWVSVCTILCLMFWLLSIQNRREKDLRVIAVHLTFFTLATFCVFLTGLSYVSFTLFGFGLVIFITAIFITAPLILANIFKHKVSRSFKIFLVIIFLYGIVSNFLPDTGRIILAAGIFIVSAVCIYYIVSSWRNLKGAQWSIVVGVFMSLSMLLTLFILIVLYPDGSTSKFVLYLVTGFVLSFPLSILVYVAIRFREIIAEVHENALQVLKLSEEKKEQALRRQKTLEEEVNRQTAEIRTTLDNLRSTQTQLIQSEKMASLGELTAGIAHEIQNPLNFVNNFSEVSIELLEELQAEAKAGHTEDVIEIATGLTQNLQKINQHGKRADSIVKGMLQHSRTNTGERQPTNVNTLADEFLKLSYHGLRAKDNSFSAEMTTHFDENLPKVNVVQQDIGRVLLNLFNNAFYAVKQKQKSAGADYKPAVTVTTFAPPSGGWGAVVRDNGNGIPEGIKDKIMQPFFTTKPTGEGTGLGLSLSYDIVVKGHGGKIEINSEEGNYTEFTITIPA